MDKLDEHGKKLYQTYLKAKKEWLDYVKPLATNFTLNKIQESGKIYFRFSYIFINNREKTCKTISPELQVDNVKDREECRTIYKKLSLKFHPDKFKTNDNLFTYINASYENNNYDVLTKIFSDILIILEKTTDEIDQYIQNIQNIQNLPFIHKENVETDFTESTAYHNFLQNKVDLQYYMNPDELINHIENSYMLDDELLYYNSIAEIDETVKLGLLKREIRLQNEKT